MKLINQNTILIFIIISFLISCNNISQISEYKLGDKIIPYKIGWKTQNEDQILSKLNSLLPLIVDRELIQIVNEKKLLQNVLAPSEIGTWVEVIDNALFIKYDNEYDEIRIINRNREIDKVVKKIDETIALKLSKELLEVFIQNGIIHEQLFFNPTEQIGYKIEGSGSIEMKETQKKITEYRVTYRPRINNIEMINTGIRFGINQNGELCNVRVGGASPEGIWKNGRLISTIQNNDRRIKVSTNDIMSNLYNNKLKDGEINISSSKIVYVIPEGEISAIVEPTLLVSFTESRIIDDLEVISRKRNISYALSSTDIKPVVFDTPETNHQGTKLERK